MGVLPRTGERLVRQNIAVRKRLMGSAQAAKDDCFSMQEWIDSDVIQEFCKDWNVDTSLLEHIAWFVWTFRKKG